MTARDDEWPTIEGEDPEVVAYLDRLRREIAATVKQKLDEAFASAHKIPYSRAGAEMIKEEIDVRLFPVQYRINDYFPKS